MKILKHILGSQEVFSTPGIELQLGNIVSIKEELEVDAKEVDEVFEDHRNFTIKKGKLIKVEKKDNI